jgi:voltage-gated potassium channel
MSFRRSVNGFFERFELPWEIMMVTLAVVYVLIGFLPDWFSPLPDVILDFLAGADLGLTAFFLLEFILRIAVAPSRGGYLREHWMDLIALVPVVRWLRAFRILRILRLLRVMRVVHLTNLVGRLGGDTLSFLRMNGLGWVLLGLAVFMFVVSVFYYQYEGGTNPEVTDYWDALYFSLVTWTTPGYGDILPLTAGGRICGLLLIISGLLGWGILVANLAAVLAERLHRREDHEPAVQEMQSKLLRLHHLSRSELVALKGALNALIDDRLAGHRDG